MVAILIDQPRISNHCFRQGNRHPLLASERQLFLFLRRMTDSTEMNMSVMLRRSSGLLQRGFLSPLKVLASSENPLLSGLHCVAATQQGRRLRPVKVLAN